jgi:hypothetical protein
MQVVMYALTSVGCAPCKRRALYSLWLPCQSPVTLDDPRVLHARSPSNPFITSPNRWYPAKRVFHLKGGSNPR